MPMSSSRCSADTASVACSDESTKWPVSADCTAIRAVSTSRISPTRMTSGSWRRIDFSPPAKVMPGLLVDLDLVDRGEDVLDRVLDRHDVALGAVDLARASAYSVVVLPLPVGPAQITMPYGERISARVALGGVRRHAEVGRAGTAGGSCRAAACTTFSPPMTARWSRPGCRPRGRRPSCAIWPSCGRRRSTMFMPAMILIRLTTRRPDRAGQVEHVVQRAVDAVAHPDPVALRLDVDVGGPVAQRLGDDHAGRPGRPARRRWRRRPRAGRRPAQRVAGLERLDLAADVAGGAVRRVERAVEVAVRGDGRDDGRPTTAATAATRVGRRVDDRDRRPRRRRARAAARGACAPCSGVSSGQRVRVRRRRPGSRALDTP